MKGIRPSNDDAPRNQLYLSRDDWSPRFDSSFFTVEIESYEKLSYPPPAEHDQASVIQCKTSHPAYYYQISVFCEHEKWIVPRRYSQFQWMRNQLCKTKGTPTNGNNSTTRTRNHGNAVATENPPLPTGTCFFEVQNASFAQRRQQQLNDFLDDILTQPGNSFHGAVVTFLELDRHNQRQQGES
mmetsp:Transcript_8251/g.23741  ORF Transcript_8251/g.23741 Transcript_8251/m.23741 type:complete len:184 (+) Transcript_8251:291-842(+)|eukprot:CAMPEP_0119566068 /NCGR_PEP_ID=MMETSP1352-20130426/31996_1 /TAXON_ID=265584 /ORGANISM="Stauroneis constricta, Strain CCMP1120" /LENGTH=183 /DNA_ID=CAMNT_0007615113 /DNA_START=258 /DNA_END=809 /DNA_ORIENTATION=-